MSPSCMTPEERRSALKQAGITQAAIARQAGVSAAMVSRVIHDRATSRRVRDLVAAALHLPASAVFPPARPAGRPRRR